MTVAMGPVAFYSICQQAGLTLGANGDPNVLQVEPSRFQRDATRLIQRTLSGTPCTEAFLEGLQEHLEDSQNLRACLMPLSTSGEKTSSFSLGESLVRMLLSIDIIQSGLMEGLLDRIFGFLGEDEKDSPIPKLILQQLKWLNNIIEPGQLSAKLLEVISVSPISIQRDIITNLPEIVPDSEHRNVVLGLVELMESSTDLMVPILDALSNLNLQSEMLVSARNHVMDKLESAELDDLPIVIKFLLQTVEPDTVADVIETIRSNLDFGSINKLQRNSNQKSKMRAVNQTPEVLILDALKTGIRFQKFVTDAWFKALVAILKPNQHKVIDVMILFILHSIVSLKKKVEILIRKKIIEGLLTRKLLEETIMVHGVSLREYMPAVLSISENLLRSSVNYPIVARAASTLYTSAFQVSEAYYRQEIVGSLLVHIGSGSTVEIEASLAVLQNIVQVSRSALNEYSVFIKGILDYLDNLSLEQTRLFFMLLGSLAREDEISGNTGTLLTDLNIIIRKQLSNPMVGYKKIGVMGAIAMVQAFGVKEGDGEERGSSSQAVPTRHQAPTHPLLKISVSYLLMIRDACQKSPICMALTFDELASMVLSGDLEQILVHWIKEEFSEQFAGTFVGEQNEVFTMKPSRNIAMERWMDLDGPESVLCIKIMPRLCAEIADSELHSSGIETPDGPVYLCSLFKLLQATEKMGGNGLDDIDGLLGCGITMFKKEYLEDISEVYSVEICHAAAQGLLCAINWFREISNAFSCDASDQTMARVIVRLQQISELERMLRHILKCVPGFTPLEAGSAKSKDSSRMSSSLGNALSIQSTSSSMSVSMGKKAKQTMDVEHGSKSTVTHSNEVVTYESLAPYLREFELDVFHVLRFHEPITREIFQIADLDSKSVELQYPELLFLLQDLLTKISYKLPPPTTSTPFGKKKEMTSTMTNNALLVRMGTVDFVRRILTIVPHVVTRARMMLTLLSKDEDVIDQKGEAVDSSVILECLNISMKCLCGLLSWNEIKSSDQKDLRLELLKSLALDKKSAEQIAEVRNSVSLSTVAAEAFTNLSSWRELMPNFESSAVLLEILDKMLALVSRNWETSVRASKVATEILSCKWPASNMIKPERLAYVLGQQIGKSDVRLEMIKEYITKVLPSFEGQDEGRSALHPLLNKNTFTTYTKVLHIQLAALVGEFSEDAFDDTKSAFEHISGLCVCFQRLAAFVKSNDKREVLGVTLRHSKMFMEQFIKHVLPFFGIHFRGHQDVVAKIFKNYLQAATRSLQNVCGHAKASREQALMAMVPAIKKTMESLIFQVKLMLENNDAGAAFWLGNLKHRNLRGEEISSQLPDMSEEGESDHDPDDDNEDDDASGTESQAKGGESSLASSKKRTRVGALKAGTAAPKKAVTKPTTKTKKMSGNSGKGSSKKRGSAEAVEDGEARIHTKSQISNSDMSEDEHDQLAEEKDDEDSGEERSRTLRRGGEPEEEAEEEADELEEGEEEEEEEEEDEYADRMLELQDEKAERRRRVRNPYIDDVAMDEDEDEEDDDEEEEEEEEEEDDEEEGEDLMDDEDEE